MTITKVLRNGEEAVIDLNVWFEEMAKGCEEVAAAMAERMYQERVEKWEQNVARNMKELADKQAVKALDQAQQKAYRWEQLYWDLRTKIDDLHEELSG